MIIPTQHIFVNRFSITAAISIFLVASSDCRPVNEPGSPTLTRIIHLPFFNQVVNPCGVTPDLSLQNHSASTTSAAPMVFPKIHSVEFYRSMESALKDSATKLGALVTAEPSLPQCNGITLDSLRPATLSLQNTNLWDTTKQTYNAMIFLTTHFHLMALDRQMTVTGDTTIVQDELLQPDESIPSYRYQRCGNESDAFPTALHGITSSLESIICLILNSASEEQTTSLRQPLDTLQATVLYRYHDSCSTLQTRDCLVVRETENSLRLLSTKYEQLVQQASAVANQHGASGNVLNHDDDFLDNEI